MALDYQQAWNILKSGTLSDFSIVCGKQKFKVHRLVLYPKSSFFESCVEGGFKESQEGTLSLKEYDSRVVAHMILFTYLAAHTRYEDIDELWPELQLHGTEEVSEDWTILKDLHYVALYELGIFLMYDELKAFAQKELLYRLDWHWATLEATRSRSETPQPHVNQVTTILQKIYERIPASEGSLRLEVTANCIERHSQLQNLRETQMLKEIWRVIQQHELFAWQLGLRLKMGDKEGSELSD